MSEIGGISHENIEKELEKVLNENIEASRVIAVFEGAKDLNESQKLDLFNTILTGIYRRNEVKYVQPYIKDFKTLFNNYLNIEFLFCFVA